MGLAVIEGKAQRKATDKDLAEKMGYSPSRRSTAWLMGNWVRMAQVRVIDKDGGTGPDNREAIGPYGELYLKHFKHEMERTDEGCVKGLVDGKFSMKAKISHAGKRAVRKMTKDILRDLYFAWMKAAAGSGTLPIIH